MAPVETIEVTLPTLELPTEDGVPLESSWHRMEINLLIEVLGYYWRQRSDFYCGGNMFLYYSLEQVRHRDYRGPDFFVVLGVDGSHLRKAWVVWEDGGRYLNLIIELLSTTTAQEDNTVKKALYEQTFRTPEYCCYDPESQELMGFSALQPFAFSFDPGFLAERLSSLNLVPLLPYFHKTDFGALEDLIKTFLYPLPLGYVLGWQGSI